MRSLLNGYHCQNWDIGIKLAHKSVTALVIVLRAQSCFKDYTIPNRRVDWYFWILNYTMLAWDFATVKSGH
jgi:hypothetical protein